MTTTTLYRHFDAAGTLLYIGISLSPFKRLDQHKRKAEWFHKINHVRMETFPTREEALAAEEMAIKTEYPLHNVIHNRLDLAAEDPRRYERLLACAKCLANSQHLEATVEKQAAALKSISRKELLPRAVKFRDAFWQQLSPAQQADYVHQVRLSHAGKTDEDLFTHWHSLITRQMDLSKRVWANDKLLYYINFFYRMQVQMIFIAEQLHRLGIKVDIDPRTTSELFAAICDDPGAIDAVHADYTALNSRLTDLYIASLDTPPVSWMKRLIQRLYHRKPDYSAITDLPMEPRAQHDT